ncbi:MAG: hypothetical protein ACRCUT_13615 [Spirochaetota bacterium]
MKKALCCLLVCCAACCSAKKADPAFADGSTVTVSGTVTVIGNEPFTKMALRPAQGKEIFLLPAEFKKDRKDLIGKNISITGKVAVKEMTSADKKYRRYEYQLSDVKIEGDTK